MNASKKSGILSLIILAPMTSLTGAADLTQQPPTTPTNSVAMAELNPRRSTIGEDGVGSGFLRSAQNFTVEAGAAAGMASFGSHQAHDLALLSASYGLMLGGVVGKDHWYRGNIEGRIELFGGMVKRRMAKSSIWSVATSIVLLRACSSGNWRQLSAQACRSSAAFHLLSPGTDCHPNPELVKRSTTFSSGRV
jgi:hypothetical protein